MNTRKCLVHCVQMLALILAGSAVADTSKAFLQKNAGDQLVRLPLLAGLSPACDENVEFADRIKKVTPATHELLMCAIDAVKWDAQMKQGKAQQNFYPAIVVTVQKHQPGGPLSRDEFARLEVAARARLPRALTIDKDTSLKRPLKALTEKGGVQAPENYEQSMQGFFEVRSKAPSFSFLTNRSYAVTEDGKTNVFHEVNAILTVFHRGELLQVMTVDALEPSRDASRITGLVQRWLDAFNSLNP